MIERNQFIDSLRGFAILVMIVTHVTAFFPSDKIAYWLWNWSHFAVPIFVFCSTYLFLQKQNVLDSRLLGNDKTFIDSYFPYLKKRFTRLLMPYYIFLLFFLLCLMVISPQVVTFDYILKSILLIGGVDINWLVLLFLYLTIILPFFARSFARSKVLFWIFFSVSLVSVCLPLFVSFPFSYKLIMWLPWSMMLSVTLFYKLFEKNVKMLVGLLFTSIVLFALSYFVQSNQHHSLVLIHNKYPPNIFYLSYGVAILFGLALFKNYLFSNKIILKVLHFFSVFSYSLYFLHYLLLTIFVKFISAWQLNWITLLVLVLTTTIIAQILLTYLQKSFKTKEATL